MLKKKWSVKLSIEENFWCSPLFFHLNWIIWCQQSMLHSKFYLIFFLKKFLRFAFNFVLCMFILHSLSNLRLSYNYFDGVSTSKTITQFICCFYCSFWYWMIRLINVFFFIIISLNSILLASFVYCLIALLWKRLLKPVFDEVHTIFLLNVEINSNNS